MGGFLTLAQLDTEMARLAAIYPRWLSAPIVVGKSRRGRSIKAYCVTEALQGCEGKSDRPSVLYTALVHAREPQTLACLLHFVKTLLEQAAAGDGGALSLLLSRKVLLLPVANPDGYVWNEQHSPHGGGMKRKNGLATCTASGTSANDGVDLNRNFGYKWNFDSIGSSPRGCGEEFRGASAFSEPETQAIRDLVKTHRPMATLHWHGWGNDLAFPYSFAWRAALPDDDLSLFQEFASEMTARNHYASGRAWEVVGYTTNGEADDWGWGEERVLSMTLEVGASTDGFWPPPSRIAPIAEENYWPAVYLLHAAGPQLQLQWVSVSQGAKAGAATLNLSMQNNGLKDFEFAHAACSKAANGATRLRPDAGWSTNRLGASCTTFGALRSRGALSLPALQLEWDQGAPWLELLFAFEPLGGRKLAADVTLRVATDADTLGRCDELCLCPQLSESHLSYSYACRQQIKVGSVCKAPKPAALGNNNFASGVDDEFFSYTASQYTVGGICKVGTTHRNTLIAVYADCGRVGAQKPVAFSNSEGHLATVDFPCTAGHEYFLFWNAEYRPGRHSFSVSERCGTNCQPRSASRELLQPHGAGGARRGRERHLLFRSRRTARR